MSDALRWYLALSVIALAGIAPARIVVPRFALARLAFARPLGALALALLVWLAATTGAASFGTALVLWAVAGLLVVGGLGAAVHVRRFGMERTLEDLVRELPRIAVVEAVWLGLFVLLTVVRAQTPGIFGNEKPMELMMLNAVHQSTAFPPPDPWFAGEKLAYYYLGYVQVDAIARLGGVDIARAFNLALATAGALAGTGVFALCADLVERSGMGAGLARWGASVAASVCFLLVAPIEGALEGPAAAPVRTAHLMPGGEGRLDVALVPGAYLLLCNFPAHVEGGMVARLSVSPDGSARLQ